MAIVADDIAQLVDAHGVVLFRYALRRLRRREDAEDAVQETLLAALRGHQRYRGEGKERSWLIGILRHKIADTQRSAARESTSAHADDGWWDQRGGWLHPPRRWQGDPQLLSQDREFLAILHGCLGNLPRRQAQAMLLRTVEEVPVGEVATRMQVSLGNLGVLLHRARLRLRECLERRWFAPEEARR